MQVSDPFRLNDWEIKKFLGAVLAVQIAMLVTIDLETAGIQVPILRQLICFIYLTFIPGALILRVLNLHGLGSIKSTLFTIGLSLAAIMFTGVLINEIGPYLGIAKPISLFPIVAMLTIFVLLLSLVCYFRDRYTGEQAYLNLNAALSPPALFLYLVPFLAIFGTFLMNNYDTNLLLIILILVAAAIVLLVGFDKVIPKELFPLAIFVVAISLAFHNSLISSFLNGWDIQKENYYASMVISNGFWTPSVFSELNAMLSIVMVAPFYSIVTKMDTVWVFKIIYPFLLALVPVGLYEVFKKLSNEKIAFISSFFFISLVVFYTEMLQLARQEIAELTLVLVIMLIIDRSIEKTKWSILFVIFSFSLVLSHYGLTYIFIGSLVVVWVLLYLSKRINFYNLYDENLNKRLSLALIMALVTFCLLWYMYTAQSDPFMTILAIVQSISGSMVSGFMNPNAAQGLALISTGGSVSQLHKIYLYLMLFTQIMIIVGVATFSLKSNTVKLSKEFFAFSLVLVVILLAGISVPFFASAINTTRLYQIALIFLAIFFVIGWLNVFRLLGRVFKRNDPKMPIAFRTLAIFLAIFLIFNTGLVFEVYHDSPISYALNNTLDTTVFNKNEVASADWILSERNATLIDNSTKAYYLPPIYSDSYLSLLLSRNDADQIELIPSNYSKVFQNSYIYLGTNNMASDQVIITNTTGTVGQDTYKDVNGLLNNRSRIYVNGESEVFR